MLNWGLEKGVKSAEIARLCDFSQMMFISFMSRACGGDVFSCTFYVGDLTNTYCKCIYFFVRYFSFIGVMQIIFVLANYIF